MQKFFATCPKGLENLLFQELTGLNASSVKETVAGVSFAGDMNTAMRACLYSRFASRIILTLHTFSCEDDTDLYMGAHGIAYEQYFLPEKTIAVTFNGTNNAIRNTQYGALRVKDAVCDRFVDCRMPRPDVQKHHPDIHIIATLKKGEVTIGLDLSGSAQFWREYHRTTGAAPLKENLAAAMVARSGFTGKEQNLVDPMCGSATVLLEAAALATDTAPGLMRQDYGFRNLKDYDDSAWQEILKEARERSAAGKARVKAAGLVIHGFDADGYVIERARANIEHAGFADIVTVEQGDIDHLSNPCRGRNDFTTVVVTNPPYGERMGNFNELIALYTTLGFKLKSEFPGGIAAVISSSPELLSCLRLAGPKTYRLFNGALDCQLRVFRLAETVAVAPENAAAAADATAAAAAGGIAPAAAPVAGAAGAGVAGPAIAPDFANRLTKNLKRLTKWAERNQISAWRAYDADLPDYNAAIDRYNEYYVIQEYQAPSSVPAKVANQRLLDLIAAVQAVTAVPGNNLIVKTRDRQKGSAQYARSEDAQGIFMEVYEGQLKFKVNLQDYLDTGLFLDSRPIRRLIGELAAGKDFLNLFAYTATASVAAAKGGARSTTSVDMSRTYLDWGQDNFRLNGFDLSRPEVTAQHHFQQADCLSYLSADQGRRYDLIYIDPPTFSNSKRMERSFDVQRDHSQMLGNLTRHLNDGGVVIFCTNKRNFKLDEGLEQYGFAIENITAKTFDPDFERDQKLHTCFKLVYTRENQTKEPEALVTNTMRPHWARDLDSNASRFTFKGEQAERRGQSQGDRGGPGERSKRSSSNFSNRFDRSERSERGTRSYGERSYAERSERSYGERSERGQAPRRERDGAGRSGGFERNGGGFGRSGGNGGRGAGRFERGGRPDRERGTQNREAPRKARVWGPEGVKDL